MNLKTNLEEEIEKIREGAREELLRMTNTLHRATEEAIRALRDQAATLPVLPGGSELLEKATAIGMETIVVRASFKEKFQDVRIELYGHGFETQSNRVLIDGPIPEGVYRVVTVLLPIPKPTPSES